MAKKYNVLSVLAISILFVISTVTTAHAATETKTFYATADAWIDSANPNTTHSSGNLNVINSFSPDQTGYILVKFDISTIPPGATVSSSWLEFYTQDCSPADSSTPTLYANRLISVWSESTVTWSTNIRTTNIGMVLNTATSCIQGYWVKLVILDITQAWVDGQTNYGVKVTGEDDTVFSRTFLSRDHATFKPKLTVKYSYTPSGPTNPSGTSEDNGGNDDSTSTPGSASTSADGTATDGSTTSATGIGGTDTSATQSGDDVNKPLSILEAIKHPSQLFSGRLPWWKVGLILFTGLIIIATVAIAIVLIIKKRNKKKLASAKPAVQAMPELPKKE